MGSSKSSSSQTSDYTQQTTFAPASAEEQALRQQFSNLGDVQQQGIQAALQQALGGDLLSLSPQYQNTLDQAFTGAMQRFQTEGQDYADFLSGSRGMRMSDTPIASQALQRYGLGMADLLSQRAMAGLNLGLGTNQLRMNTLLNGASALPAGSVAAFNPLFQERMASGTTRTRGTVNSTQTNTPSLMSQIGQGLGLAGQIGSLGMGFMSGMGGAGAAGTGAGTSNFGPFASGYKAPGFTF